MQVKGGIETNAAKVVGQFPEMRFYSRISFSETDPQLFAAFDSTPPFGDWHISLWTSDAEVWIQENSGVHAVSEGA